MCLQYFFLNCLDSCIFKRNKSSKTHRTSLPSTPGVHQRRPDGCVHRRDHHAAGRVLGACGLHGQPGPGCGGLRGAGRPCGGRGGGPNYGRPTSTGPRPHDPPSGGVGGRPTLLLLCVDLRRQRLHRQHLSCESHHRPRSRGRLSVR